MNRKRNEQGQFVGTVTDEGILAAVRDIAPAPATASDVADILGCTRKAAWEHLSALHEKGSVERKKVGGRAVVWWPAEREEEREDEIDLETRLKRLSNELDEPLTVGQQVYEIGDTHTLTASAPENDGGEHDPDGPFFGAPALDAEDGEPIEVADTDDLLGDALADESEADG